jgi:hypothetical protein
MANYRVLTPKVFRGRGHAARAVGVPYNVYRITSASTGDWLVDANKIATDFYVLRRPIKGGPGMETDPAMKSFWFEFVGDSTTFLVGDVFIQDDTTYGAGFTSVVFETEQFDGLCLAFNPPIAKKVMAARIDRTVQIYRPANAPTTSAGYWDTTIQNGTPLILQNGQFAFSTADGAVASKIPAGVLPQPKPSGGMQFKPEVPSMLDFPTYHLYIPPLNGEPLQEGDRIVDSDGSTYVVMVPWIQLAGVSGYQLACRRVQAGKGQ